MKAIAIDDDRGILRNVKTILEELKPELEVITFERPYEALEEIEKIRPDLLLIDKVMKPIDGIQLKRFVEAIDDYDPFSVMISGVPEYGHGFDMYVVKKVTVSKMELVLERYKNRSADYLLDYLEERFDNKSHVELLYNLINTKEVEKHDLVSDLLSRVAHFLDIKPDSARRRLHLIIKDNENVFGDNKKYTPKNFLNKLREDYREYFQSRLFGGR